MLTISIVPPHLGRDDEKRRNVLVQPVAEEMSALECCQIHGPVRSNRLRECRRWRRREAARTPIAVQVLPRCLVSLYEAPQTSLMARC